MQYCSKPIANQWKLHSHWLKGLWQGHVLVEIHYNDVIMTTIASQITSLTVVYSIVYSGADQRKHQSSASLAFVWWIHRDRWIPRTKGQLRGKCVHLMTSSCKALTPCVTRTSASMVLTISKQSSHPWKFHQHPEDISTSLFQDICSYILDNKHKNNINHTI